MKKKTLIWLVIILALAFVLFLIDGSKKEQEVPIVNEPENGEEIIMENYLSAENQIIVYDYIQNNISDLSPEKEVLGGTFYTTSIDFLSPNSLIVSYEDGHIDLVAEVLFNVTEEKEVEIIEFNIIEQ